MQPSIVSIQTGDRMKEYQLIIPNRKTIQEFVSRFENDSRYGLADKVLSNIFRLFPENANIEQVLTKVVLLNGLYNTNVFAVVEMAKHIQDQRIDPILLSGSSTVVDRVARLTIRGKTRRHYSFATKYCSWHFPETYPIYDNLVERLIWLYQKRFNFASFERSDLQDYQSYREILAAFQGHFDLERLTYKEIDKFLWFYGKDLFQSIGKDA